MRFVGQLPWKHNIFFFWIARMEERRMDEQNLKFHQFPLHLKSWISKVHQVTSYNNKRRSTCYYFRIREELQALRAIFTTSDLYMQCRYCSYACSELGVNLYTRRLTSTGIRVRACLGICLRKFSQAEGYFSSFAATAEELERWIFQNVSLLY